MEKMPFQPEMTGSVSRSDRFTTTPAPARHLGTEVTTSDWRRALPVMASSRLTLRRAAFFLATFFLPSTRFFFAERVGFVGLRVFGSTSDFRIISLSFARASFRFLS